MSEETAPSESIISKVQKLLERADHPGTSAEERDACIRKADAMMLKYQIDQAMLDATKKPEERRTPISDQFRFDVNPDFVYQFQTMLGSLGRANGVRVASKWDGSATLVGYQEDVEWLKLLTMQVFREFVVKISPSWNDSLSVDDNVKTLKEAAWKWVDIAIEMHKRGLWPSDKRLPPNDGGYLIRAYKRACKAQGVEPDMKTQNHEGYRYAFIESFTNRIVNRANEIYTSKQEAAAERGTGTELALRDAGAYVDDLFYRLFPSMSPEARARRQAEAAEAARRARERDAAYLASLSEDERRKELRRRERELNQLYKGQRFVTYDNDGARAGRRAADGVNLSRNGSVSGNSKKELG